MTHLGDQIFIGEEDGEDGASGEQILDFERVDIWVVGGFVIVEHQIQDI